ncbi:MAG TPA: hypothetical protein VD969_10285 [Symbiobacteriaceae bacterium]|nr:hypothetical protein [Symbiobacteriaceae bacterium]
MRDLLLTHAVLVLLPRLHDGRIILIRPEVSPCGPAHWTLPSCLLPPASELSAVAADLLHRTTDYQSGRLSPLGRFHAGSTNHCFLAGDLRPSSLPPAPREQTMTTAVHPAELKQMVRLGLVECGAVLGALTLLDLFD